MRAPKLAGRWLVSAYLPGRGKFYGEMQVDPNSGSDDEFTTRVKLTSVKDGSTISRTGHSVVYAGYAWRGRSKGTPAAKAAPDDPGSEMREVMWVSPDQSSAEGRWFWGEYQEFGFDVKLQRPSADPTLIGLDRTLLKAGSQGTRVRLIAESLPAQVRINTSLGWPEDSLTVKDWQLGIFDADYRLKRVAALRTLRQENGVTEVVILSTCNRTEVYWSGPASGAELSQWLERHHGNNLDLNPSMVGEPRVGCGLTGVALINISQLHAAAGDLLDLFGQPLDLGAVLFARRGHV